MVGRIAGPFDARKLIHFDCGVTADRVLPLE